MKKVLAIFTVIGIGGWLCYANGVFSMATGGKIKPAEASDQAADNSINPYELHDRGEYGAAIEVINSRITHKKGDNLAQELKYLGSCYMGIKDGTKAGESWQRLLKEFPQSQYCGDACFGLSEIAHETGKTDEELKYLERAANSFPNSDGGAKATLKLGNIFLAKGDPCKARVAFSKALASANAQESRKIKEILAKLNKEVIFSQVPNEQAPVYCVQSGDSLGKIAKEFGTTIGMIKSVNMLKDNVIFPGDRLKIVKGKVHLEVSKTQFLLSLFIDGIWIQDYQVGIGANDKTPEGEFEIDTRIANPPWHYRGKVYAAGDPENVLGTRWLGFKPKPGLYGFGIHGTSEPASVPGAVSKGCIRMLNEDVEQVFEMIPRGTKVVIRK